MNRQGLARVEFIVITIVSLTLVTFALAAAVSLDNSNSRSKCANNLHMIGMALMQYSNDAKGPFPRTMYDNKSADKPTAFSGAAGADPFLAGGPDVNDVSACFYLLLRREDIASSAFICPATGKRPYDFGGGTHTELDKSNFPSGDYLGYSYADPYPSALGAGMGFKMAQGMMDPTFALAADSNPGDLDALTAISPGLTSTQLRVGNSLSHSRDGQNVLYADFHVEFQSTPFCGQNRDNIYTFGDSGVSKVGGGLGVIGSPVGPNDSVLLPVASSLPTPTAAAASELGSPAPAPAPASGGSRGLTIAVLVLVVVIGLVVVLIVANKKTNSARS